MPKWLFHQKRCRTPSVLCSGLLVCCRRTGLGAFVEAPQCPAWQSSRKRCVRCSGRTREGEPPRGVRSGTTLVANLAAARCPLP